MEKKKQVGPLGDLPRGGRVGKAKRKETEQNRAKTKAKRKRKTNGPVRSFENSSPKPCKERKTTL